MGKLASYAFYLVLILILVVYWKGTSTNANVFGNAINNILLTLQGRSAKTGEFANYPN